MLLDFVAPVGRRRGTGVMLCVLGVLACGAMGLAFERELGERNRLDAAVAATAQPRKKTKTADPKLAAEQLAVEHELAIPWTQLLSELEAASVDVASTISVLEVQPDPAKHLVRITVEARSLGDALHYLERLQRSTVLRYPMLESHEVKKDDPDHAVKVKLAAEWRS